MAKRDSFLLRLNPATLEAIRRWADDEFRSMNGQIEMLLQRALKDAGRTLQEPSSIQMSTDTTQDQPPFE